LEEIDIATQPNPDYILTGRLTNGHSKPLEGLIVRAYDRDPKTPENPLGKGAVTDAEGSYKISFTDTDFTVNGLESGGPNAFIRVYDGDELLGESLVKRHSKKRISINFRLGDILLLAVGANFQREAAGLDTCAKWMQAERGFRPRRSLRVAIRGMETLAGRLSGAVSTNDWDALPQQMHAILTTEGEGALFIGKQFQRHASDVLSASQKAQKTKFIRALAAFRTALTAERQELVKTRNGALHACVAG
jgi:hypothetical protein